VSATRAGSHRVLLVDDEPSVRRFACRVLTEQGYIVEEAANGVEALDRVREGGPPVDLVVSDVVMPRLNGVELTLALNALHPSLPVILISGYATGQLEGMGIAAPCGILGKPFSGERLIEEVRRCLEGADPMAVSASDGSGRA
jgi:two-component system cell cycle sensor histidine kinase/response regulator CckA